MTRHMVSFDRRGDRWPHPSLGTMTDGDVWDYSFFMDTARFRIVCVVTTVLGVSLLLGGTILHLAAWSIVLGFSCLGLAGPFVFVYLGRKVEDPAKPLVYYFGYSLPGAAFLSIAAIVRHAIDVPAGPLQTVCSLAFIFGLVWLVAFLGAGAVGFSVR